MIPRRPLLLVLAALLATSGCVSVPSAPRPAGPSHPPAAAGAPLTAQLRPDAHQPPGRSILATVEASTHKPKPSEHAKAKKKRPRRHFHLAPAVTHVHRHRAPVYAPAAPRIHRFRPAPAPKKVYRRHHRSAPNRRPQTRHQPPPRSSMRPLCRRASAGVTSAEVAALCRGAYGS
ncbi:hypothetical protein [Streptomyces sp. NBC_00859]|uniref:hypothetical protein n=1 Tax=Streptomyces sp. NBC_00859 TaxID=2903682 RepID=UPI00386D9E08|nr:hypothetical protein OG584_05255 [Streptomyces sp. NBC_00859]